MSARAPQAPALSAVDEVDRICRDLIRIDSSNFGDGSGPGERAAAEYVMTQLSDVGLAPELVESAPGRASVLLRLDGENETRPGLVLHGHLDVVPAEAADWQVDPFAAEERDGCIWGRGAVDMKDMVAMMIATIRDFARRGERPARPLTVAFFADEEAGGVFGSRWVTQNHPEWFEGATEAVSEVGGFSVTLPGAAGADPRRAYLIQTAEKGIAWLRLHAYGAPGHGSLPHDQNAIVRLAEAITRIDGHTWPREYTATVRGLLGGVADLTGIPFDESDPEPLLRALGSTDRFVRATLQDTANVTMLDAGYKHNVVPARASAALDCRFLPGHEDQLMDMVRRLAGAYVEVEVVNRDIALDAPFDADIVGAMSRALAAEDPGSVTLPYCLSGGTDNKALATLGIRGYGFAPLRLPADLEFAPMFHGIDERVPIDSLQFGTRTLARFLRDPAG